MDGMHDLGGRQGFGRVRYAPGAPAFHAAWERRVNALYGWRSGSASSTWTSTGTRSSAWSRATTCPPATTSARSQAWRRYCVEKGVVTREELERRAKGEFPLSEPSAAGPLQPGRARTLQAGRPGPRQERLLCRPRAHARLHPRQDRCRGQRVAGLSVSRRPRARRSGGGRADLRRRASAPRTCGPTRPTRRSSTSASSSSYLDRVD